MLPHTLCVASGLADPAHPTGVLGALSPPAIEASGSAPMAYPATHALRISPDRVKSAECPTNVKEVVARFAQGLQDGIKTLPRPWKPLAQLMDGDAIVVRGKALIHDLEGYEPNFGCPKKFML